MQFGESRNNLPNTGFKKEDNCIDNPLRKRKPEKTIKGNRDGIICLYHVVSPVFTRAALLTGLVNNKNTNNTAVIGGRVLFKRIDVYRFILKIKQTNSLF